MQASVIIPTYNRKQALSVLLQSLSRQTFLATQFEVIVVDDGSSDETPSLSSLDFPFSLRYYRQENQGEVVARNSGAKIARGEILLFLDDDIRVESTYVADIVAEHQGYPRSIVLGTLYPHVDSPETPFQQIVAQAEAKRMVSGNVPFSECFSGVLSVSRDGFFEIGMMCALGHSGRNPWGGIDFGYRAHLLGYRFRRCGSAVAYHDDFASRTLVASCGQWRNVSQAAVLLFQRYPALVEHLPMLMDKRPIRWRHDPSTLLARKLARSLVSTRLSLSGLEMFARLSERTLPKPFLLAPLYRWILGGYMFRGYREGLRRYGPVEAG